MTPKQDVIHYFSFVGDYGSMIRNGKYLTPCGMIIETAKSTWRVTKVTCKKCLESPAYQRGVAITMSRRLKVDIEIQSKTMGYIV